ncbi:MAG TPA: GRAM domain-containing protein [Bacteroidales bacterium]|nr:GRAM domain-containing protein [Bacteroidales bacterium]
MVVDLKANELVLKAGDSNYFASDKQVNGKLILTNQRVYFRTLSNEDSQYNLEIMPNQIQEILYFNTLKIFPNGLNIILKEGKELKFKIGNRNDWGKTLNRIY